jgi:hypothetical protein
MMAVKSASKTAVTCGACVTEFSMFSAIFSRMRSWGTSWLGMPVVAGWGAAGVFDWPPEAIT